MPLVANMRIGELLVYLGALGVGNVSLELSHSAIMQLLWISSTAYGTAHGQYSQRRRVRSRVQGLAFAGFPIGLGRCR